MIQLILYHSREIKVQVQKEKT